MALQQELDDLLKQRRDLQEKLRNSTKEAILKSLMKGRGGDNSDFLAGGNSTPTDSSRAGLMLGGSGGGGHHQLTSADTLPLIYELNLMRNVNRLLQKNMMELNRQYARSLCDKLSSLPSVVERSNVSASSSSSNSSQDGANQLRSLSKQSNDLMVDVFNSLGNYKVENLRNRSRANENKKNNINLLMVNLVYLWFWNELICSNNDK